MKLAGWKGFKKLIMLHSIKMKEKFQVHQILTLYSTMTSPHLFNIPVISSF